MDNSLNFMALASTALTSLSKLGSGYMGSSLSTLQESIASSNAALLRQSAGMEASEGKLSLDQGALDTSRTVASLNRTLGSETAGFSSGGLDPTSGSPLLLEGFSASQAATDMALIGAKAELGNAGALQQSASTLGQAASAQGQASAFGMKATQDVMAGWLGAGTSMLSGLSNPSQWKAFTSATNSIASGFGGMVGNLIIPGNWGGSN